MARLARSNARACPQRTADRTRSYALEVTAAKAINATLQHTSIDCFKQRNDRFNDRRIRQARKTSARANDKGDETT
jgi:hypothetical protein